MATVAIPAWNANGVLPPINSTAPTSADRSPYPVSLSDFAFRFGTSPQRRKILDGFLKYRQLLHSAGLTVGFQWLDGSFLEDVETTQTRDPNDLDVVTFFSIPIGVNQQQLQAAAPTLTNRALLKANYFVDAFLVSLGSRPAILVEQSAYWYGVWSHRRDDTWKGFLQIDLDPTDDALAALNLRAGGTP